MIYNYSQDRAYEVATEFGGPYGGYDICATVFADSRKQAHQEMWEIWQQLDNADSVASMEVL